MVKSIENNIRGANPLIIVAAIMAIVLTVRQTGFSSKGTDK